MRFLADENFPGVAVEALRRGAHDTSWVRADSPGIPDGQVVARSIAEDRVLLTFDTDFGDLVVRRGAGQSRGVVLFRIEGRSQTIARRVVEAIASRDDWAGHFSVVEPARIRMRPLAPGVAKN